MPLTNCEINLDLKRSKKLRYSGTDVAAQATTFSIIDIRLYIPVVAVSIQDNTKLLEQLKPEFKRTTN